MDSAKKTFVCVLSGFILGVLASVAYSREELYENFSGTSLGDDFAVEYYPTNPIRGEVTVQNGHVQLFPGISEVGGAPTGFYYRANIFTTNNSYLWHNAFPFSYEYKIKKWSRVPPSKTDSLRFLLIGNQNPVDSPAPESLATNVLSATTSSNAIGLFLQWNAAGRFDCVFYLETNSPSNLINAPNSITQQITGVTNPADYTIGLRFTNNTHGYFYSLSPSGTETRTEFSLTDNQLAFFTNSVQMYLIGYNHLTNQSEDAYYEIDYLRAAGDDTPPHLIDVTATGSGSVDPGGSVTVSNGADQTFMIEAAEGYHIADITTNGNSIGFIFGQDITSTFFTWENVTEDGNLGVYFEQNAEVHVITASVVGLTAHGSINPAGDVSVTNNENAVFVVTANRYYHVADITTNEASVEGIFDKNVNDYTFVWNAVTADGSITATIAENLAANYTPEWWLAEHGLTNSDFDTEALSDQDGDGHASWKEYIAGTIPTNAESVLQIVEIKSNVISWHSESNRLYTVGFCKDLLGARSNLAANIQATPPLNAFTNNDSPSSIGIYYIDVQKK